MVNWIAPKIMSKVSKNSSSSMYFPGLKKIMSSLNLIFSMSRLFHLISNQKEVKIVVIRSFIIIIILKE